MRQGHWSPIVRQMRGSSRPDGMCLVVGSCATGFPAEQNKCALDSASARTPPLLSRFMFIIYISQSQAAKAGLACCMCLT